MTAHQEAEAVEPTAPPEFDLEKLLALREEWLGLMPEIIDYEAALKVAQDRLDGVYRREVDLRTEIRKMVLLR